MKDKKVQRFLCFSAIGKRIILLRFPFVSMVYRGFCQDGRKDVCWSLVWRTAFIWIFPPFRGLVVFSRNFWTLSVSRHSNVQIAAQQIAASSSAWLDSCGHWWLNHLPRRKCTSGAAKSWKYSTILSKPSLFKLWETPTSRFLMVNSLQEVLTLFALHPLLVLGCVVISCFVDKKSPLVCNVDVITVFTPHLCHLCQYLWCVIPVYSYSSLPFPPHLSCISLISQWAGLSSSDHPSLGISKQ